MTKRCMVKNSILLALILVLPGCTWLTEWFGGIKMKFNPNYRDVKVISVEKLQERMDDPDVLVINVLSKETFDDCHISGSLNVPLKGLKAAAQQRKKEQEIVVYCASYTCPASKEAFLVLKELGFINIEAYEGGMKEWKQKELPHVGECKLEYLK